MGKPVVEAHAHLYHYTTAVGLQCIVETQQLWAANISYLNDAEEHTGFFERRLPHLLERSIREAITGIASTESDLRHMIDDLVATIRRTTLKFNNPYITSFCSASNRQPPDDGLLSQWRGYGLDGGYEVVFETDGLQRLLVEENESFYYQFLFWGDVEYYDQDTSSVGRLLPERNTFFLIKLSSNNTV